MIWAALLTIISTLVIANLLGLLLTIAFMRFGKAGALVIEFLVVLVAVYAGSFIFEAFEIKPTWFTTIFSASPIIFNDTVRFMKTPTDDTSNLRTFSLYGAIIGVVFMLFF